MTGTEPVLEARALRVSYPGAPVLRGRDLAVRRREIVGLMGDAASGKSTAALALMGLARAPRLRLRARTLRRHGSACPHRHGPRRRAAPADRGRADLRPRRDDPGAGA